jgi:uncharacterized protein (TIGR03435 family)
MNYHVGHKLTRARKLLLSGAGMLTVAVVGVLNTALIHAQSQSPNFEVASLKPHPQSQDPGTMMMDGGPGTANPQRITYVNIPLQGFIEEAYGVSSRDDEVLGAPGWVRTDRYDLLASLPEGATRNDVSAMMRTLLAERFELRTHLEKRNHSLYELVVAKGGPKMKPGVPNSPDGNYQVSRRGVSIRDSNVGMARLAGALEDYVGRRVVDKTGLSGMYSVEIEFAPPRMEVNGRGGELFPSVFTAVQERLGLKLEEMSGPVDVLVIDHISRLPAPN